MSDNTTNIAYKKCVALARDHYENFPVARLVPKRLVKHVAAVYAFARTADDIADEEHESIEADSPLRIEKLATFESQLDLDEKDLSPEWDWIFTALKETIKTFDIPKQLFRDLISAFAQDVVKKRYANFEELKDYCRRSANPVGRLVLILHGLRGEELFKMSDAICTALQLANFWQDMSVDKVKNRIYVPQSDWVGLNEDDFFASSSSDKMRDIVKFQCERTEALFKEGQKLPKHLPFPLSLEIKLTIAGGRLILQKITQQNYDTLSKRPSIGKSDKAKVLLKSLMP